MPALLTIINNGNSDQGDGGRWRAGEAVNVLDNHEFGWFELPKTFVGDFAVAQINGLDLTSRDPYEVVRCTDGGTITSGDRSLDVSAGDCIVHQFTDAERFWTNFGDRPQSECDEKRLFHWRISDKETNEVGDYMQTHNKVLTLTQVAGPDANGLRRITAVNEMVTASGGNSWDQANVTEAIDEWNARYPDCGLIEYQPLTADTVYFEGTFTQGQKDEFESVLIEKGLSEMYARRRWKIDSAGMAHLASNDGFVNSTASELSPYFRDGLLD